MLRDAKTLAMWMGIAAEKTTIDILSIANQVPFVERTQKQQLPAEPHLKSSSQASSRLAPPPQKDIVQPEDAQRAAGLVHHRQH